MAETKKEIRTLPPHELESGLALVWESFSDSYAEQCDQDTLDAFWESIDYEYMLMSMGEGRIRFWGAWEDDFLVGVCAVRELEQIELLQGTPKIKMSGFMSSLEEKIRKLEQDMDDLRSEVDDISCVRDDCEDMCDELGSRVEALEGRLEELENGE